MTRFASRSARVGAAAVVSALVVLGVAPLAAHAADTPPDRVLDGANPGIGNITGLAFAPGGLLYFSDIDPRIDAFSSGANGDVAPDISIVGPATGLVAPRMLDVDGAGNIYLVDNGDTSVKIFAAGSTGDVAPIRVIQGANTGFVANDIYGIAVDGDGNIYVTEAVVNDRISVFAPAANGNVAPIRVIEGASTGLADPNGIVVDPAGNLYVANAGAGTVTVYAPGASGDVAPIRTIAGAATQITEPYDVDLNTAGELFVSNFPTNSILIFASGAAGNVAPVRDISGPSTALAGPVPIAIHGSGDVAAGNAMNGSITEYAQGPVIGTVTPNSGPVAGGTTVTITGAGFTMGTVITIGGVPLVNQNTNGVDQIITGETPPHAAGVVDVVVTSNDGSYTLVGGFTYLADGADPAALPPTGADVMLPLGVALALVAAGLGLAAVRRQTATD